jgi:beta-1,4-N-acetylglucosaminyltransferase
MRAFVTVGSTRFDALLDAILCTECIQALAEKGFHELVIQSGEASPTIPLQIENLGVHISCWSFKSSLLSDFQAADLVISHAGSSADISVVLCSL